MKYIEIKNGIFVNADDIEGVIAIKDDKKPEILSKVYTHHNNYPSVLPAETIIRMLTESNIDKDTKYEESQEKILNIMKQQQHFAG